MVEKLTLVSIHLCPYVQRAAITLAEKGVAFERRYVDLAEKPNWFTAVSPLGKVPVLLVGNEALFESSVIVEFLEETQPVPLHPQHPLQRARHRAWMEFGSSVLADLWVFETTKDEASFQGKRSILRKKFEQLEGVLAEGPYFSGERFRVVDAVFAPVFRYFDVFDQIQDFGLWDGLPKLVEWREALSVRPSVINAVVPEYPELLRAFVQRHDGHLAKLMRKT